MKLFWGAKPIKNLRLKNHYGGSNHIKKNSLEEIVTINQNVQNLCILD
jgi:hypothetical protein